MSLDESIEEEYNRRFDSKAVHMLSLKRVPPVVANRYNIRFNHHDIICMHKGGVSPALASSFGGRFSGWEIQRLFDARCPGEIAIQYPERFDGMSVSHLYENEILPEIVRSYPEQVSEKDIFFLIDANCSSEAFSQYDAKFDPICIATLHWKGILAQDVNKYSNRFDAISLQFFIEHAIPGKYVRKFSRIDAPEVIEKLFGMGADPTYAERYPESVGFSDIPGLMELGCSPTKARAFDERFRGYHIAEIVESKVRPETANKFSKRFCGDDVVILVKSGCSWNNANRFSELFSSESIAFFHENNCDYGVIRKYSTIAGFSEDSVVDLVAAQCLPNEARKYDSRFTCSGIAALFKAGCSADVAQEYPHELSGTTIAELFSEGCFATQAKEYIELGGHYARKHIFVLYKSGITPELIGKASPEYLDMLDKLMSYWKFAEEYDKYKIIGTGASGLVLLRENSAWKMCSDVYVEYDLLDKLHKKHRGKQKHVAKFKRPPHGGLALELEYIKGSSLEELLKQKGKLDSNTIVKYAYQVVSGLVELREAGIWYHRDVRPANILIEESTDQAIIIDLGIATTDRHAAAVKNRRFGGPTDILSVGQIVYYMATGIHLFDKSQSMRRTLSSIVDLIVDERTKFLQDKTGNMIRSSFELIDRNVSEQGLSDLIKYCLLPGNVSYKQLRRKLGDLFTQGAMRKYAGWLKHKDIVALTEVGISPEVANRYTGFGAESIELFVKAGVDFGQIENYDCRFDGSDRVTLLEAGCSPADARNYDSKFSATTIVKLYTMSCSAETANEYLGRFTVRGTFELVTAGCSLEQALEYPLNYSGEVIAQLHVDHCSSEVAMAYQPRFKPAAICEMFGYGCGPELANSYPSQLEGWDVVELVDWGIFPDSDGRIRESIESKNEKIKRGAVSISREGLDGSDSKHIRTDQLIALILERSEEVRSDET